MFVVRRIVWVLLLVGCDSVAAPSPFEMDISATAMVNSFYLNGPLGLPVLECYVGVAATGRGGGFAEWTGGSRGSTQVSREELISAFGSSRVRAGEERFAVFRITVLGSPARGTWWFRYRVASGEEIAQSVSFVCEV